MSDEPPRPSPLDALHRRLGARLTDFAGWTLPIQFAGVLAEHQAARTGAALFDVSHMAQVTLATGAAEIERLVPGDIRGLAPGRQRYTLLLDEAGGILDDVMITNWGDRFGLIANASRADTDLVHLRTHLGDAHVAHEDQRALLALQGPQSAALLAGLAPQAAALPFMAATDLPIAGIPCRVARSGYTGEDGFEISAAATDAEALAEALLAAGAVPAGLAARDILRLEAGLCLYGQDIDHVTTPIEAGLAWTIPRRRREAGDFPGAVPIADQLAHGAPRRRVGLRPEGRVIARAETVVVAEDGTAAGSVTSGGFSPSLGGPIAMGYIRRDLAAEGTPLRLAVRGQLHAALVVPLPFVPHRYAR